MGLFSRLDHSTSASLRRSLLTQARLEVIPVKNLQAQLEHIPAGSPLSVTASPNMTLDETLDVTEQLMGLGHDPVPHLAARMVESKEHLARLLDRMVTLGRREVFLVGGDASEPFGDFEDAVQVLEAIVALDHGLEHIGVAAYPDGHGFISDDTLHEALLDKQEILSSAGVDGHAATQMCFDAETIRTWLRNERTAGFVLPVHLGIPGAVERTKLLATGARLGVGTSLRFLQKNTGTLARMFAPGGYDPNQLLSPLAADPEPLGFEALHIFTFNQIKSTVAWRDEAVGKLS